MMNFFKYILKNISAETSQLLLSRNIFISPKYLVGYEILAVRFFFKTLLNIWWHKKNNLWWPNNPFLFSSYSGKAAGCFLITPSTLSGERLSIADSWPLSGLAGLWGASDTLWVNPWKTLQKHYSENSGSSFWNTKE